MHAVWNWLCPSWPFEDASDVWPRPLPIDMADRPTLNSIRNSKLLNSWLAFSFFLLLKSQKESGAVWPRHWQAYCMTSPWPKLTGAHCGAHFGEHFGAHFGAHSVVHVGTHCGALQLLVLPEDSGAISGPMAHSGWWSDQCHSDAGDILALWWHWRSLDDRCTPASCQRIVHTLILLSFTNRPDSMTTMPIGSRIATFCASSQIGSAQISSFSVFLLSIAKNSIPSFPGMQNNWGKSGM